MNLCQPTQIELIQQKSMDMKLFPMIKKKENPFINEINSKIIGSNDVHLARTYGDRFIPRRYAFKNLNKNVKKFGKNDKNEDILKTRLIQGYWRRHNFEVNLNYLFDLNSQRLLTFNDEMVHYDNLPFYLIYPPNCKKEFQYQKNKNELDWPCKPRSRPLVFSDSTHDLPGFGLFSGSNVLAWSKRGIIAASFDTDLVIWTPATDKTLVYKINNSKTLSFSPNGVFIAIGLIKHNKPVLELLDLEDCGHILFYTNSYTFQSNIDEPSCLEWDKKGKKLLCGTKSGLIYIFKIPNLKNIKILNDHKYSIVCIKLNPNSTYFATSDIEGYVNIMIWPSCTMVSKMGSSRRSRAIIDWHPWTGVDLAVSEEMPASIVIVNVQTKEIIAYYQRRDRLCSIETLSFNKISAELIVSYCIKNPDDCITCEILVMASLNRIVDVLKTHEDRVRCVLWSPDDMQLATAGDDDTLIIWNFFSLCGKSSSSEKKNKKKSNRFLDVLQKNLMPFDLIR